MRKEGAVLEKRLLIGGLLVSASLFGLFVLQKTENAKPVQAAGEQTVQTESTTFPLIEESGPAVQATVRSAVETTSNAPVASQTESSSVAPEVTASSSQLQAATTATSSEETVKESVKEEPPKEEEPKQEGPKDEVAEAAVPPEPIVPPEPPVPVQPQQLETHYSFSVKKNQTTASFIQAIGQDAQAIAWQEGLYGSVMIAQAILETGSGNSQLSSPPYHNLFGIKGTYQGNSVNFSTQEDKGNSQLYTIQANFRQYPSYKESLEDYAQLLKRGLSGNPSFYQKTWKAHAATYQEATAFLTGRYATDTNYDKKLNALIETYELTQYDEDPVAEKQEEIMTATEDSTTPETSDQQEEPQVEAAKTKQEGTVRSIRTGGTKVMPSITQRPANEIAGTRKATGKEVAE